MTKSYIPVLELLTKIGAACEREWNVPTHIELTRRNVPVLVVGKEAKVRVVIFAKTHRGRVFVTPMRTGVQEHVDFHLDWDNLSYQPDLVAFACGAAKAHQPVENS